MSIHTLELLWNKVNCDVFSELKATLSQRSNYRLPRSDEYCNNKIQWKYWDIHDLPGVSIVLEENRFQQKTVGRIVRLRINPRRVLGDDTFVGIFVSHMTNAFIETIDENLKTLHKNFPSVNDLSIKRVDLCCNCVLESTEQSISKDVLPYYISILQRGDIPKGYQRKMIFSPTAKRYVPTPNEFAVFNDSVELKFYDKLAQLQDTSNRSHYKPSASDLKEAQGMLRMEICMKGPKMQVIKKSMPDFSLRKMLELSRGYLLVQSSHFFTPLFGKGNFCKMKDLVKALDESKKTKKTKKNILNLTRTASKRHSLYKAKQELLSSGLSKAQLRHAMDWLDDVHISPILLPENCPLDSLPNPWFLIGSPLGNNPQNSVMDIARFTLA